MYLYCYKIKCLAFPSIFPPDVHNCHFTFFWLFYPLKRLSEYVIWTNEQNKFFQIRRLNFSNEFQICKELKNLPLLVVFITWLLWIRFRDLYCILNKFKTKYLKLNQTFEMFHIFHYFLNINISLWYHVTSARRIFWHFHW
jgi:hypothetical protein